MVLSRIIGIGSYVPPRVITNYDLEKMVDTSDDWITGRTGIKERRINEGEVPSDLATKAGSKALKHAGVNSEDLDLIVVATVTPDMTFPSTACFVQKKIGAIRASAFDISAACSGFLFAIDVADRYIKTGGAEKVLVIGVDLFSRILNWKDRSTCILFGDGAGAVVLTRDNNKRGILSTHIHTDGRYWEMLYAPLNGTYNKEGTTFNKAGVKMKGNETFKVAVKMMEEASLEALRHNRIGVSDVNLFVPHQANARIIKATAQRLSIPIEKVFMNIEKYGNTSSASIPLALDEAYRQGKVKEGNLILLVAFGGGFTWGSSLIRW